MENGSGKPSNWIQLPVIRVKVYPNRISMDKLHRFDWVAIGMIILLAVLYGWTMLDVPFHPDESTQIYMSQDLSRSFTDPLELAWDGKMPLGDEDRIRAIDAPLAKITIGIMRTIFSIPALESDWNWSLNWEENRDQGALPSREQLLFARAALTACLPISLWFFYQALQTLLSKPGSLIGTLLLGLNPLLLLHGRRAMSEGLLLLGICFFFWAVTRTKRNPWLIGLSLGLTIAAKHSGVGLLPAGILAVVLIPDLREHLNLAARNIVKLLLVLFSILLLLNPFYWRQPLAALQAGIQARFQLASEQREDHLDPDNGGFAASASSLILNLYYTDPQTEEVGNYLANTSAAKQDYLSLGIHTWSRDMVSTAVLITFSLAGLLYFGWKFGERSPQEKENILLLALSTLGMGAFTIYLIPWQRYAIAVLPFAVSWIVAGLEPFFLVLERKIAGTEN